MNSIILHSGIKSTIYLYSDNDDKYILKTYDNEYKKYYLNEKNILIKLKNNSNIIKIIDENIINTLESFNSNKNKNIKINNYNNNNNIEITSKKNKILPLKLFNPIELSNEIDENTIKLKYYEHGNLLDLLNKVDVFDEPVTKYLLIGIFNGIKYAHDKNICHTDIKIDNILIDIIINNNVKDLKLIICDWELSLNLNDSINNESIVDLCRMDIYMSPSASPIYIRESTSINTELSDSNERFHKKNKYYFNAYKNDIWQLGIVLFTMIFGFCPYENISQGDFYFNKISNKKWNTYWNVISMYSNIKISNNLKNLIESMLDFNEETRLNIDQVLNHPWFNIIDNISIENLI